jgi:hypothetical protein
MEICCNVEAIPAAGRMGWDGCDEFVGVEGQVLGQQWRWNDRHCAKTARAMNNDMNGVAVLLSDTLYFYSNTPIVRSEVSAWLYKAQLLDVFPISLC